jgi:hypothetical protein
MMRNIWRFGRLAGVTVALMAFAGTSSAMAVGTFTASESGEALSEFPLLIYQFTFTDAIVECETAEFVGVTEGKSYKEQTLHPAFSKCEGFGFAEANVIENGCEFTLKSTTDENEMATFSLNGCTDSTKGIQFEVNVPFFAKCVVDTPEQSIASAISYLNVAFNIDVRFFGSEIMFDATTSTGFCPLSTGTHSGTSGGHIGGESRIGSDFGSFTWSGV